MNENKVEQSAASTKGWACLTLFLTYLNWFEAFSQGTVIAEASTLLVLTVTQTVFWMVEIFIFSKLDNETQS